MPPADGARPARPRVLHLSETILARTETFIQQRLEGDRFEPVVAGWVRATDGLDVPCPSLILPDRVQRGGSGFASRAARRATRPLVHAHRMLDLASLLVRAAPTVVHAHFGTVGMTVAGVCERLRIPLVVSFYGFDVGSVPRQRGGANPYTRLFSTAAALTAEGPALARSLMALGAPADAVKLLPLGFPASLLAEPTPARFDGGAFNLLQIARFVEKKGIDVTLRGLASARRAGVDARLVLIGDGPLRPELEALIDELGVRAAVTLPGFVAHTALEPYFARAHAYVQPSRTAADGDTEGGHPTVILEAQARGIPVLATTHADIPLVVRHGVSGLLGAENDHEALARHIASLAKEPRALAEMGEAARRSALRRHDPGTLRALRERVYREAVRRYRKRRSPLPSVLAGRLRRDPFRV
jgi:colanic acid/amylovoran biosynthesis glycosyltransferase